MSRDVGQKIRRLLFVVPYVAKHPDGVEVDIPVVRGEQLRQRGTAELDAIAARYV